MPIIKGFESAAENCVQYAEEAARPRPPRYNRAAVQRAIVKDKRIKSREARLIHALLKGRQKEDE